MNKFYSLLIVALILVSVHSKASTEATLPVRMGGLYAWWSNLVFSSLTMTVWLACFTMGGVTSFLSNDGGYLQYYCFNQFLGSITSDTWLVKF
jgi:hypothetical protein